MDSNATARFLRRQFFVPHPAEGSCVRIEVRHKGPMKVGAEVYACNFAPEENVDESVIKRLVDDIDTSCQDWANQLEGVQTYIISAYFQLSGDRPVQSFPVKCRSENDDEDPAQQSEPATGAGLVQYVMRQNEQLHRSIRDTFTTLFSTAQRVMARQSDQIDSLMAQKFAMLTEIESAQTTRDERQRVRVEAEKREARIDSVIETFLPLIPAAVNMISGKPLLPAKTTPERSMVAKFLETITPEQLPQLRQACDPEAYGMLVTMLHDLAQGIDANLPPLFRRFINQLSQDDARIAAIREILSMGQQMSVQTIIQSLAQADERAQAGANGASA